MCRLASVVISAVLADTPFSVQAEVGTSSSGLDRHITVMSYNTENLFDAAVNPANPGGNTYLCPNHDCPPHVVDGAVWLQLFVFTGGAAGRRTRAAGPDT